MRSLLLALLLAVPLAACGGHPDPGGDVVGSWRELPSADETPVPPIDQRSVIAFAADGTWTTTIPSAPGASEHGKYSTADGNLTVTQDDGSDPLVLPYLADDQRLLLGILAPDDDGDDAVATWTGRETDNGASIDVTITLGADHTATLDRLRDGQHQTSQGTWAQTADAVAITLVEGDVSETLHTTLYQGYLGSPYEKL